MDESIRVNRALWDERAPVHAASPDYGFERFAADPAHLSDCVRFDLARLGSVAGLDGVHLKCHIGTDTVSLARLGARMEGLDFSPPSLVEARRLAVLARVDPRFHEAEVYDAPAALGGSRFDLVYTGIPDFGGGVALCLVRGARRGGVSPTFLCFAWSGGQVMWARSQVLVSTSRAVRMRAWRGLRRVTTLMVRPPA